MTHPKEASTGSGRDALPTEQQQVLQKAVRLEWVTIGVLAVTVAAVGLVAGQSQAMRAAWLEDMLSFLPPIAFLVATRIIRRNPNPTHPYGYHRAIGVAHLVAATALLIMGGFLIYSSVMSLVAVEKPPVGMIVLFGQDIWLGWLMVVVMALSGIPPVILGRMKLKLAPQLHDKVLYADADMNKADWSTALATIVGVLGIGMGLWWMDAAAAIVVALSIVYDGVTNLKAAVEDLTDTRVMTLEEKPHPTIDDVEDVARATPWVAECVARARDQGHVFHVEMFVVPQAGHNPSVAEIRQLRDELHSVDWKVHDVVIAPVPELPRYLVES